MGNYVKMIALWFVALFCLVMILNVNMANISVDTKNAHINDSLEVALISNQDYSQRVEVGAFYLQKDKFEKDFISRMDKYGEETDLKGIEFSYLPSKVSTDPSAISGVKVKVTTTDDKLYQGTVLVDNNTTNK